MPDALGWVNLVLILFCIARLFVSKLRMFPPPSEHAFFNGCLFVVAVVMGSSLLAANSPNSESVWARMAGFLPASDAGIYFAEAARWPSDFFDEINSRRPLNTTWNIALFHAGGSTLPGVLILRCGLLSLAIAVFTWELSRHFGKWLGVISGMSLLNWVWPFGATFLTESNSLVFACFGMASLLLGVRNRSTLALVFGLLCLVLATSLRPLNPFLPSLLAVVSGFVILPANRLRLLKIGLLLFITFGAGWIAPKIAHSLYAKPGSILLGNVGHSLLGLSRGTDWYEATVFFSKEYGDLPESKKSGEMLRIAIQNIKRNPFPALAAAFENARAFTRDFYLKTTGAIGMQVVAQRLFQTRFGQDPVLGLFLLALGVGCFLGFRRNPLVVLILAASLISILAVAPLAYRDGGWRSVAASYPALIFLFPIFGIVFQGITISKTRPAREARPFPTPEPVFLFGIPIVILFLMAIFYPITHRLFCHVEGGNAYSFNVLFDEAKPSRWTGGGRARFNAQSFIDEISAQEEHLTGATRFSQFLKENITNLYGVRIVIKSGKSKYEIITQNAPEVFDAKAPATPALMPNFHWVTRNEITH
jgi:hypothetical protein